MREEYAIIDTRLIDTSESELVKLLHISFVDANRCADPPAKLGDSQYTNYVSFANPPFVVGNLLAFNNAELFPNSLIIISCIILMALLLNTPPPPPKKKRKEFATTLQEKHYLSCKIKKSGN